MSSVKRSHTGGDSATKPTSGASHKSQTPGIAGNNGGKMSWGGSKK